MGISLRDLENHENWFHVNFWNWRPLVESIQRLGVVASERAQGLHEPFCGNGLSAGEARVVADALEAQVLPAFPIGYRMFLDGTTTAEPDDGKLHRDDADKNYSVKREVVGAFVAFCRGSAGFEVL